MVFYSAVRYCKALDGIVYNSTVLFSTVCFDTVLYITAHLFSVVALYGTVPYDTLRYCTAFDSIVLYCTVIVTKVPLQQMDCELFRAGNTRQLIEVLQLPLSGKASDEQQVLR